VITRLKKNGKKVFFVTNNATKSRAENVAKLTSLNIPASEDEIICSSYSAATYCRDRGFKRAFVVGEKGLIEELGIAGLATTVEETNVDVVVAGLDRQFSYDKLSLALKCIQNGAAFLATNRDATYPAEDGKMLPGAGSLISALETASGKEPVVTGKPSQFFVDFVKRVVGVERCLMIGDRLDTDIAFGLLAGFRTMLVTETGVHGKAQLDAAQADRKPHFHAKSVADLEHVFNIADMMMMQFAK
jgi:phosphoglycolate/pyridoxal phosphate phosphatase family enzyme